MKSYTMSMKKDKKLISIVLPCLNEAKNIPLLIPELIAAIPPKYTYEIIFVDDGSNDNSYEVLTAIGKTNPHIKAVFLYRRFGHQAALKAGIDVASGDAVITMDSDFQHPPEMITEMIEYWEEGYDLIRAKKRTDKSVSISLKIKRSIGYFMWRIITGGVLPPGVSDFRLADKKVADYIRKTHEQELFLRGLFSLGAKKIKTVPYTVQNRKFGNSKYTPKMFVNMFVNGFISFSIKPLRLGWICGLVLTAISGLYLCVDIVTALLSNRPIIEGFTTIVALILCFSGFMLFYMGIIAEYIGIIFKEVKRRPLYMVDETMNFK